MLIQIDGTSYDWFGTGESWTLHLAVDDATSEVPAGVFMPTERQLGYCILLRIILLRYGIPMALYSDKHSIFLSHKEGNLTQFGMMMEDLCIEMIYVNSSQAKGRVERYNGTVQRRLPNDIRRFKINSYEKMNEWFNSFYVPYINRKFAFVPLDPNDAYIPLDGAGIDDIFTLRHERTIQNDTFSLNGMYYGVVDERKRHLRLPIIKKIYKRSWISFEKDQNDKINIHQPSWWFFSFGHSPALKAALYSAYVVCDEHYLLFPVNGSSNSNSSCSKLWSSFS